MPPSDQTPNVPIKRGQLIASEAKEGSLAKLYAQTRGTAAIPALVSVPPAIIPALFPTRSANLPAIGLPSTCTALIHIYICPTAVADRARPAVATSEDEEVVIAPPVRSNGSKVNCVPDSASI